MLPKIQNVISSSSNLEIDPIPDKQRIFNESFQQNWPMIELWEKQNWTMIELLKEIESSNDWALTETELANDWALTDFGNSVLKITASIVYFD